MYNKTLLDKILVQSKNKEQDQESRRISFERYEKEEFPIWKRLKIDKSTLPDYQKYNNQKTLMYRQEGLRVTPIHSQEVIFSNELLDKEYGPSIKHRTLTEAFSNTGTYINVDEGIKVTEPIIIQLPLNKDNPLLLDHHVIHAMKDSRVVVVLDYRDENVDGFHNGVINIIVEEGADVQVIKLQNFSKRTTHIFSGLALVKRDGKVTFNSIDLGSTLAVTDFSTYLQEENSEGVVESIYLGDGKSKMDLSYNMYHEGRRSESNILVKGALLHEAHKVFRGNLFFRKGAKKASGSEQEYVILLNETVKSDSIPALMCQEDDVQGEHAASAGQVDENKLFYLMSRGLTEKEAKQLIIMASFTPVIDQIPIEGLQEMLETEISIRLSS
ncbi:Fe-S cluster assembly protein SufD [Petrocella atlantisensis]|uniref:Fe-S cluster assembly protein SufD n=1 Tax=Petrocella atlantisensis TaxID=2173034 RepID=A0A3P7P3R7_9FIRM|nr:Fe-S cluster assembly protein SufD [Petrocella atlantisensis]VDN48180.1 Fe-S cluster assembly protein SufD [Petrocella atlantisensis]